VQARCPARTCKTSGDVCCSTPWGLSYHRHQPDHIKRAFGIDIETCHRCGGKMKIIAAIEDPHVIKKILERLGLATRAPMP